jgi:NAD-dependent DNA ligase
MADSMARRSSWIDVARQLDVASVNRDGETGEDIAPNAKTINEIPLKLLRQDDVPIPDRLVVRGEVYMRRDEFGAANRGWAEAGERQSANPPNADAGSARQRDPSVTALPSPRLFWYAVANGQTPGFGPHWVERAGEVIPRVLKSLEEGPKVAHDMASVFADKRTPR